MNTYVKKQARNFTALNLSSQQITSPYWSLYILCRFVGRIVKSAVSQPVQLPILLEVFMYTCLSLS